MADAKKPIGYADQIEHELSKRRILDTGGFVDGNMLYDLSKRLRYLSLTGKKPIQIYINTPGGSIIDGLGVYDVIRDVNRTAPVNICAIGGCMSMGTVILQAANRRQAYPNTTFLLHELRGDNGGTLSQMRDTQVHVERLQKRLNAILLGRMGITEQHLASLMNRKDTYIEADEALALNLIDEIVEV